MDQPLIRQEGNSKAVLQKLPDGFLIITEKDERKEERRFGILSGAEAYSFFKKIKLS